MKTLKKFEFKANGNRSSYDWDTILSGAIVQLDEGSDYSCKATTLATLIRNQAKKRGQTVSISKVEGGTVVQAHKS